MLLLSIIEHLLKGLSVASQTYVGQGHSLLLKHCADIILLSYHFKSDRKLTIIGGII